MTRAAAPGDAAPAFLVEGPSREGLRGILPGRTVWRGDVWLAGDVVVPEGAALEIAAGARVRVVRAAWKYAFDRPGDGGRRWGTETDRAAIVVWGSLRVAGSARRRAAFDGSGGLFGGVALLGRAEAEIKSADFTGGGLAAYDRARFSLEDVSVTGASAGLSLGGFASAEVEDGSFEENGVGARVYDFARLSVRRGRFAANGTGLRADDAARVRLDGAVFRANRAEGLSAVGRADVEGTGAIFEGHREKALSLEHGARAVFADARVFGNGVGFLVSGSSRLALRGGAVGPNRRAGLHAAGRAALDLRDVFFHSHGREPALLTQDRVRAALAGCRFHANGPAAAAHDDSLWTLDRCSFEKNAGAALQANGRARLEVRDGSFSRNRLGLFLLESAAASLEGCELSGNEAAGVRAFGRSEARLKGCRFDGNALGAELHDESRLRSRGSEFRRQRGHGALLRQRAAAAFEHDVFAGNAGAGAQAVGEASLDVEAGLFESNGVGAGFLDDASGRVRASRFHAQRREGVVCATRAGADVSGNRLWQNAVAVGHFASDRSRVRGNRLWENEKAGVCAGAAAPEWRRNDCADNGLGLDCRDDSRPLVRGNLFERSRDRAVAAADRSAPRLTDNRFAGNNVAWTRAGGAAVELSGNRFEGNLADTLGPAETK